MTVRFGNRFLWAALLTAVPLPVIGWLLGQNWLTVALVLVAMPLADVLIVAGFFDEVLTQLPVPTVADEIRRQVSAKLEGPAR